MSKEHYNLEFTYKYRFKDPEVERAYKKQTFRSTLFNLQISLILTFVFPLLELVMNVMIKDDFYRSQAHKRTIVVLCISVSLLSFVKSVILALAKQKERLVSILSFTNYATIRIYFITYFLAGVAFDLQFVVLVKYFYIISTISLLMSSTIFSTNLLRLAVNILTGSIVNVLVHINNKKDDLKVDSVDDIIAVAFLYSFVEYLCFCNEKKNRTLYRLHQQNIRSKEFYKKIIDKSASCMAIFRDGEEFIMNDHMRKNYSVFKEILGECCDKDSIISRVGKHLEPMEEDVSPLDASFGGELQFERLGIYKVPHKGDYKYFELFLSEHEFFTEDTFTFTELLAIDYSQAITLKSRQQEVRWKNKLLGKLSHEFTSPLIAIQTMAGEISEETEKTEEIIKLCDFLHYLIKEISEYCRINDENTECDSNSFCLNEVIKENLKIAESVNSLNTQLKSKKSFKTKMTERDGMVEDINQYTITVNSNLKAYSAFILNVFMIFQKIAKGPIEVKIDKRDEHLEKRKLPFIIKCNSDFDIEKIKSDEEELRYDEYQGLDISYSICVQMAARLGLCFTLKKVDDIVTGFFAVYYTDLKFNDDLDDIRTTLYDQGYYLNTSLLSQLESQSGSERTVRVKSRTKSLKKAELSLNNERSCLLSSKNKVEVNFGEKVKKRKFAKEVIIVADDLAQVRKALVNMCRRVLNKDYLIEEVNDGCDVLSRLFYYYNNPAKGTVVAIFSDEYMEFMNGSQVLEMMNLLVENGNLGPVPFVCCTAFTDSINLESIKNMEPFSILNKPIEKQLLRTVFDQLELA